MKHLSKKNKILITIFCFLLLISPLLSADISPIPDEVYAKLTPENPYYLYFTGGHKKIIWVGENRPLEAQLKQTNVQFKKAIDTFLTENNLTQIYEHKPLMKKNKLLRCKEDSCPENYLITNCSEKICIIFPASHKILKTTEKKLFNTLLKVKDWADYSS